MEQQQIEPQGWAPYIDWSHYFFLGQALCDQKLLAGNLLTVKHQLQPEPPTTPCWLCEKNLAVAPLPSAAMFRKLGLINYRAPMPHVDVPHKSWYDDSLQYSLIMKPEGLVAMQRRHRWQEVATFPYPVDEEQLLDTLVVTHGWPLLVEDYEKR